MYKNILVPMALDHGVGENSVAIARRLLSDGGKITALHVYEAPDGTVGAYIDAEVVQNAFDRAKARLEERITAMPDVSSMIVKGHSGRSIIDTATALKADCIVMGSHKPGLIDYFLGSTAARVVQHAPCAVHVARDIN
ncbi:Nucleotide-binding universal stress protein, UspA family [Yoonia rosea]|uniref:Nucleotide-binding universal stress protein, UspA family n=1 Tax=Yoonia rosea TaxID=287098 RepID=A0A1R3X3Y5_9RHOB|nr:universal stress protein [Yoonia rosea]SIT85499.1 Nucleotide-binding universal stress protein, UspA family [Yoonia rosea]